MFNKSRNVIIRRFSSLYAGTMILKCILDLSFNEGNSRLSSLSASVKYFSSSCLTMLGYGDVVMYKIIQNWNKHELKN